MQMQMTARDKKLLVGLSIFVIVVCIGYWGILPILKDMKTINNDIATEKEIRDVNEMKMSQLPMLQIENEELENSILEAKKDYYPIMSADEIDKYFTTMALDYNLNSYYLNINIPKEPTNRGAYKYSKKFEEDQIAKEQPEESDDLPGDKTQDALTKVDNAANATALFSDFDDASTGIYEAQVSMRLGGDENTLHKLINDLSNSKEKLMIQSYSWENDNVIDFTEEDAYEINVRKILSITVNIYMCED